MDDTGVKLGFIVVCVAEWVDPSDGDCDVESVLVSGDEADDTVVSVVVVDDALVGAVVLVDAVDSIAMVGDLMMGVEVVEDDVVVGVALKVAEKLSSGVMSDWSCIGVVGGDTVECTKLISDVSSGIPSDVGVEVTRSAELVEWILAVDIGVEGERSWDWKGVGREEGEGGCWMGRGLVEGSEEL